MRPMIRCALLTCFRNDWAAALILACEGFEFVTLSPVALGLDAAPNPFALPEDDRVDVILLTSYWRRWLARHHPGRVKHVMAVLERLATAMVGVDGMDHFALGFEPGDFDEVVNIIKFQGVFHDRELYNYDVGPWYPGANWSRRSRPKAHRYGPRELDKVRLSVPCLMIDLPGLLRSARRYESGGSETIARGMSRTERVARDFGEEVLSRLIGVAPVGSRALDVNCFCTLTHLQRLDAIRLLEGLSGTRGIDRIPENIAGAGEGPRELIGSQARRSLLDQGAPYLHNRLSRLRYLRDLCRHRVVVAPTGYGELGQRHAWALRTGGALVCQDLSHVQTMFPFVDGENVAFCRHDLTDLRRTVEWLLINEGARQRIASEGRRSFKAWSARWRDHLDVGIKAHVCDALGSARETTAPCPCSSTELDGEEVPRKGEHE
jgi:hypothetical protein